MRYFILLVVLFTLPAFSQDVEKARELEKNKDYNGAAAIYVDLKDYQSAVKLYEKAEDFYNVGYCYDHLGQYQKAFDNYVKAVKGGNKSNSARNSLILTKVRAQQAKLGFKLVLRSDETQSISSTSDLYFYKEKSKNLVTLKSVPIDLEPWNEEENPELEDVNRFINMTFNYAVGDVEFDCVNNKYKELNTIIYNKDGSVYYKKVYKDSEWVTPEVNTLGEEWTNFFCNKVKK